MLNMLTDQGFILCFEAGWLSVELHILCSDCANHVVLITRLKRVVSPVGCAPREGPRRGPDFGAPVTSLRYGLSYALHALEFCAQANGPHLCVTFVGILVKLTHTQT